MKNIKPYTVVDSINHGIRKAFPGSQYVRMFAPNAWSGNYGRRDLKYAAEDGGGLKYEYQVLKKFFQKYPEMKSMPLLGPVQNTSDGGVVESHPAHQYLMKTKKLVQQGYTEEKAMDIVGVEID